jgi:hypothetical protein
MVWQPKDRDKTWLRLYHEHKGKIDADFGRLAFTTPPLAAYRSLDAKYTTSAMAKDLQSWALFGPPLGKTWEPTKAERERFPTMIRPLVSNPWTVLRTDPPAANGSAVAAVDLHGRVQPAVNDDVETYTAAAWHGTILPKSAADAWLAAGFAEYERIVALEMALDKQSDSKLTPGDRNRLEVAVNAHRARYADAARREVNANGRDRTERGLPDDEYWLAVGKGVLTLHALRGAIGTEKFCELMDSFGQANAGKEVASSAFARHVAKKTGKDLHSFHAPIGVWARPVIQSFESERDRTIIVYGTGDDDAANRATAELVQEAIRTHWSNQTLPIKADKDATEQDLRSHNLLLIGRPDANRIVERLRGRLGVTFGWRSFTVRDETYAHPGSAVLASGVSSFNPRFSVVVLAGLSADATTRTAAAIYHKDGQGADVLILPNGGKPKALVAPPELTEKKVDKAGGR